MLRGPQTLRPNSQPPPRSASPHGARGRYLWRRHHRIIDADDAGFSEKNIWPMDFAFRRDRSLSGGDGRDAPSFSLSAPLPPQSEPPS